MMKKLILLGLVLFTSCSQPKPESKYVDIDFENITINEFLEEVSEITGKKIIVDHEIKGKIGFISNRPVLKSELIPLANAILETKGLTLVFYGKYYSIAKSTSIPSCCLPAEEEVSTEPMSRSVFYLNPLNGAVVRTKIKPLLPKGAKVVYSKLENTLTITSTMGSLKSIQMLIEKIKEHEEK